MILALDIGNSQIFGGVFDEERLRVQFRRASRAEDTSDEQGLFLRQVLRENGIEPGAVTAIALCSVVPDMVHSVQSACVKYFGVHPFVLGPGVRTGLKIRYRNPVEVGADRIAGALAAARLFPGKNVIIVDFGTATTIDALTEDVDGFRKNAEEQLLGRMRDQIIKCLFSEELGAVLQVRAADRTKVMDALRAAGLGELSHLIGTLNPRDEILFTRGAKPVFSEKRVDLQRAWSETTFRMQQLRDNPECAQEEYNRILDVADPGLSIALTYDPKEVFVNTGASPRIAILREQGVNGQVEMGAAFHRAGFEAVDVHMSDLIAGRLSLTSFKGYAACGGFSYGDVLGGGQGWAKSILFNGHARE